MRRSSMKASALDDAVGPAVRPSRRTSTGEVGLLLSLAAGGIGLGVILGLPLVDGTVHEIGAPGGWTLFLGSVTGLIGTYLALLMVLMAARIPTLERALGRGGVMRWHKNLSVLTISFILAHAVLTTAAYAKIAKVGIAHELGVLIDSYPDMITAFVALGLMLLIGLVSLPWLRRRLSRENWWLLHLLIYVALVLSFAHELVLGPSFVNHPVVQWIWAGAWILAGLALVVYRVLVPLLRSLRHELTVVAVEPQPNGVTKILLQGQYLEDLQLQGGQFFEWRFLTRGRWWQAHPFSVVDRQGDTLRLMVRPIGDFSANLIKLGVGTRVWFEGPYGNFTAAQQRKDRVLLIAGGIGVTAIRGLLEDLPRWSRPVLVLRVTAKTDLVLLDELERLASERNGKVYILSGDRTMVDLRTIAGNIKDFQSRDIFISGSPGFVEAVRDVFISLGVKRRQLHVEAYTI
ncbi:ferric reductase-like transmembrane domain-containing protein [Ferrimicrobium sp.]|nr:ferric reductase-like transmembrane domain-containing protein [Ferrimicrobium sp.]